MKLLSVGVSLNEVCGVRDYSAVLASALEARGASVSTVWWERRRCNRDVWVAKVQSEASRERPDWIFWHYSVFAYGRRGIPYDVPWIARRLRGLVPRVALVVHEYALPFGRRGLRGFVQAATQRAVLPAVVRCVDAVLVTVDSRRAVFGRRPVAFQPVFSNLPAGNGNGKVVPGTIGVFGYGTGDFRADLAAEAVAALDPHVRVALIGAPGPDSAAAERWRRAFAAAGRGESLELTGVLSAGEAADRIASLDVLLFPDRWGPSSRKGSLAAGLAAGTAVVAIDGPERWDELIDAGGVAIVPPKADAIAARIGALLADSGALSAQAERGRAFYESRMAPGRAAEALLSLIRAQPVDQPEGASW